MKRRMLCCALACLAASAFPAAAQDGAAAVGDAPQAVRDDASVREAARPLLFPPACLACAAAPSAASGAPVLEAERLPRGATPAIGAVLGAVVGFVGMRLYCGDDFCEMRDLIGILGGAVVGWSIGKTLEEMLGPPPW